MAKKKLLKATEVASSPIAEVGRASSKRELTKAPDFFSTYANDVQVQTSAWDMRLVFGEIGEISNPPGTDEPVLSVKQCGELRMSPQLAKRLTVIMLEQLKAYEERFGRIPAPTD